MAITSAGYDGQLNETQWSLMVGRVGASEYGVVGEPDFKATPGVGDRAVAIAPGYAWGQGVADTSDASVTLMLDPVTSGSRWDLVVLRRDWAGASGTTSLVVIKGTSVRQIPSGRIGSGHGIKDDQPLWLLRVSAGKTAIQEFVDLRCWGRNGGVYAKDDLVRSYLGGIGGEINVNGTIWARVLNSSGVASWRQVSSDYDSGWVNGSKVSGWSDASGYIQVRKVACGPAFLIDLRIRVQRTGGPIDVPYNGNITDQLIGRVTPEFAPTGLSSQSLASGFGVRPASAFISTSGDITLANVAQGYNDVPISKGDYFAFGGTYLSSN